MRKYVKHGIMIVIGDIVNITVLILIVIVFVTGTFCTLDIAIRKFEATEKVGNFKVCKVKFLIDQVDIKTTVDCIRAQRAFSIQMPDQYVFCHLAFLEWVEHHQLTYFKIFCVIEYSIIFGFKNP